MNAIVAGKQEKTEGSLVWKSKESFGIWVNGLTIDSYNYNTDWLKIVCDNNTVFVKVSMIPKQISPYQLYYFTIPSPKDVQGELQIWVPINMSDIWINMNHPSASGSRLDIGNYFSSIEIGTLE